MMQESCADPPPPKGWGQGLGRIAVGFLAVAAWFLMLTVIFTDDRMFSVIIVVALIFGTVPVLLADDPAEVSSEAARLRATLNKIINHNLSHDAAITPLLQTLARENNDQGFVRVPSSCTRVVSVDRSQAVCGLRASAFSAT